ncbi:MAG: HAMP domain-containing protein [Defluviitaleaceae bacterium]|nr:HAMP domain-containing protein [Defluviitaleaceae bacterium]
MSISRLIKVLIAVFVVLASQANSRLENATNQRLQLYTAVHNLQNASGDLTRWARNYAVTANRQEYNYYWDEIFTVQRRDRAVATFYELNAPQNERDLIQQALNLSNTLALLEDEAFQAVAAGDMELAVELMFGAAYETGRFPIIQTLNQLAETVEQRTLRYQENAQATAALFETLAIISVILFAIFSIAGAVFILRKISPINKLMQLASDVAKGNLNVNTDTANISNDEIGALTQDVHKLVDVIRGMVADLTSVHKEYLQVGNIHYSIDDKKYENSFKEMAGLVNNLLISVTENFTEIADVISDGDFNKKIDYSTWVGEWVLVPKAMEYLLGNLKNVSMEVSALIESVADKGDLSFKIDETKYSGDWRDLANYSPMNTCKTQKSLNVSLF